jgi:hypothetical protein
MSSAEQATPTPQESPANTEKVEGGSSPTGVSQAGILTFRARSDGHRTPRSTRPAARTPSCRTFWTGLEQSGRFLRSHARVVPPFTRRSTTHDREVGVELDYLDRGRLCCPRTPQQREPLPSESRAPKQRCCCSSQAGTSSAAGESPASRAEARVRGVSLDPSTGTHHRTRLTADRQWPGRCEDGHPAVLGRSSPDRTCSTSRASSPAQLERDRAEHQGRSDKRAGPERLVEHGRAHHGADKRCDVGIGADQRRRRAGQ